MDDRWPDQWNVFCNEIEGWLETFHNPFLGEREGLFSLDDVEVTMERNQFTPLFVAEFGIY